MGTVHHQIASADAATWDYATVPPVAYVSGAQGAATAGAIKRVLVGPAEGAQDFIIRYFTLPAGGHSALDQHAHPHGVVVVQGRGRVLLGEAWTEIGVGDAVFVAPHEVHQFETLGDQPLGFLCVIPTWAEQPATDTART